MVHFCLAIALTPRETAAVACLNLEKKAHHSKATMKRLNCHLLSNNWFQFSLHSANPCREKENEWTHLQTCRRLSKCQIRPNLSCLDEWQALGRVSLRLLSFPIKKSDTPWERESARLITGLQLYPEKNWALRSLWQSSRGILWCGFSLTLCKELPRFP